MLRLAQLHLRSWHQKFITDAVRDIRNSAKEMGIQTGGTVPLPTNKRVYSMNRSPFVHSKSKNQVRSARARTAPPSRTGAVERARERRRASAAEPTRAARRGPSQSAPPRPRSLMRAVQNRDAQTAH